MPGRPPRRNAADALTDPSREELLFVGTTPGVEPALDEELRALGMTFRKLPGGSEVKGPPGAHQLLNLHLRTASRVLLRIARFECSNVPALQAGLASTPLRRYWDGAMALRVGVTSHRSRLFHTGELRQLFARAFSATLATLDRGSDSDSGSDPDSDSDELLVQLRLDEDVCTVSVDTSGALLYRRGYRQEVSLAPLRETLAAAMLTVGGYRGDEPVWDPMCGSGTLAIEAAWKAMRRAPGAARSFAFERWPTHDAAAWARRLDEARGQELPTPAFPIHATDVHAGALGTARRNAKRAQVFEHLQLVRSDLLAPTFVPKERSGLLVANPPYGIRVGEKGGVRPLYEALGRVLREELPGWRAVILVPDRSLEDALALHIEDAFEVQNGGIRCALVLARPER